jgi:quinol monooxygenase YgiN
MTGFVQIIEWKTSRIDEVEKLQEEFRSTWQERKGGPTRITVLADRDRPNTYMTVAEFASREEAEANSNSPETSEFAGRMAELCDGPPTFYNTDLMQQESFS